MKKCIALLIIFAAGCFPSGSRTEHARLDVVLDTTFKTLVAFEESPENTKDDAAMDVFVGKLQTAFNAPPKVHTGPVGATLRKDGSILGYHDKNANKTQDQNEPDLFTVEIDEANSRLIATDTNRRSTEHRIRPGFFTGFFLASMISRQRASGISATSFNSRKVTPKSTYRSARTRAGSGSHSVGK